MFHLKRCNNISEIKVKLKENYFSVLFIAANHKKFSVGSKMNIDVQGRGVMGRLPPPPPNDFEGAVGTPKFFFILPPPI